MENDGHVRVDVRVLSDLRLRTHHAEEELSSAKRQLDELTEQNERLSAASEELETVRPRLAVAEAGLAATRQDLESSQQQLSSTNTALTATHQELADALVRHRELEANVAELTEALRKAQAGYWEATRSTQAQAEASAEAQKRADQLESQITRIRTSRAWRLISAYRRLLRRIPGRQR